MRIRFLRAPLLLIAALFGAAALPAAVAYAAAPLAPAKPTAAQTAAQTLAPFAFVPGSFDPPTRAHFEIMRTALARGGGVKLVVMVNTTNGPKDYLASFDERAAMIRAGLGPLAARTEVVPEPLAGPAGSLEELLPRATRIDAYVGEDAFRASEAIPEKLHYLVISRPGQEKAVAPHPQVERITIPEIEGVSSSRARELLREQRFGELAKVLDAPVTEEIRSRGLYQLPTPEALAARKEAFAKAYRDFSERVPMRFRSGYELPEFQPLQSPGEWTDKFKRLWRARLKEAHGPAACAENFSALLL